MTLRTTAFSLVIALTGAVGCDQGNPIATPCRDIPANGCPLLADDSECDDPCCAAAYACTNGAFAFDHACPAFKAAVCDASAPEAPDSAAGECTDASGVDAPPGASGGPGCIPLVVPDCPLSQALFCGPTSDPCNGCDTFFVCQNGGWIRRGECLPDSGLTLN